MAHEDEAAAAVTDAKGVVEEFVGVLVLVDIVLGGLALYWARLALPDAARQLPGTGYEVVDVALLACAAAIVGKVVSLIARAIAATVFLLAAGEKKGPFAAVCSALAAYRTAAEGEGADVAELAAWSAAPTWRAHWGELLGAAVAQLGSASPPAAARLERERSTAAFTYGVAVLVVLFGARLATRPLWWVGALAIAAALLLLYSGRARQRGYLRQLAAELRGARTALLARRTLAAAPAEGAERTAQPAAAPAAPKPAIGG